MGEPHRLVRGRSRLEGQVEQIRADGGGTSRALVYRMRSLLLLAAVVSLPAFATGERVLVTPANSALAETLCVSMTCGNAGAHDAIVTTKPVKGGAAVEVTVTSPTGQVRFVQQATLNEQGQVSSTDLMRLTALVVQAIENPKALPAPTPAKAAVAKAPAKGAKRLPGKLVAHR